MKTERLTTSESLALDIIRVAASALVAFGHLSQHYFSTGWHDFTWIARGSVAVFFVLSGFVIRHVTCIRASTLPDYLKDRASRIYSVVIPALLLTLAADTIARHANPGFYAFWEDSYTDPIGRILINLAFFGQMWDHFVEPLSNSPFWSISYEVAYYLVYGVAFYVAGSKRWLWIALFCLLFGPHILYLLPLWFAGCVAHDFYQKWNATGTTSRNINRLLFVGIALAAMISSPPIRHGLLPTVFRLLTSIKGFPRGGKVLPGNYAFGMVWAVVLMRILLFARQLDVMPGTSFVRSIRFISEGTFPLYLIHFPLYVLIAAIVPYNHANPLAKLAIFVAVLALAILAGHPGSVFKKTLRNAFSKL